MPTFNRREFIPRALRCFKSQTYPNLELVVIDDGDDCIADLIAAQHDPRIRYDRQKERRNHGQKMNAACELAQGEICIVWDDDDFYAIDRVFRQITPLIAAPAYAVCGLANLYYYNKAKQQAWRYSDQSREWIGAIAFRRSAWEAKRFAEVTAGADLEFLRAHKSKVLAVAGDSIACAIHGKNAGVISYFDPHSAPAFFTPVPYQEVVDFTGGDI